MELSNTSEPLAVSLFTTASRYPGHAGRWAAGSTSKDGTGVVGVCHIARQLGLAVALHRLCLGTNRSCAALVAASDCVDLAAVANLTAWPWFLDSDHAGRVLAGQEGHRTGQRLHRPPRAGTARGTRLQDQPSEPRSQQRSTASVSAQLADRRKLRELRCHYGRDPLPHSLPAFGQPLRTPPRAREADGRRPVGRHRAAKSRFNDFRDRMDQRPRRPRRAAGHDAP